MSDIVERLRARAQANAAHLRSTVNGVEVGRPDHRKFVEWEAADTVEDLRSRLNVLVPAMEQIAAIAEGSTSANSLPNIARIASLALVCQEPSA